MMMKSVFWWRKPEYPEETTDLRQATDETFHTYGLCPVRGLNSGRSGVKQSELRRDESSATKLNKVSGNTGTTMSNKGTGGNIQASTVTGQSMEEGTTQNKVDDEVPEKGNETSNIATGKEIKLEDIWLLLLEDRKKSGERHQELSQLLDKRYGELNKEIENLKSDNSQVNLSEWWFNAVSATKAIFTARTC